MFHKLGKGKIIALTILLAIVIAWIAAPPIILSRLNKYLANFSPGFSAHIDSLELHPWRAAYRFGGLTVTAKKDNVTFVKAEDIDVSLAWRQLLRGKINTDIDVDHVEVHVDKHLYELGKSGGRDEPGQGNFEASKEDAKKAKDKLFPLQVTRLQLRRSSFYFADKMGLPVEGQLRLTEIEGVVTDLIPETPDEPSHIWASGLFMGEAKIKLAATAYLGEDPKEWDLDLELRHFDLKKGNTFLKRVGPLTFNNGFLDLFAEMKSEKGKMEGYVKPFLSQIDIVGNRKDFMSVKHFFVETFSSLLELIFISTKTETISTKIPITQDASGVHADTKAALAGVFRHAFTKEYTPQIEDSVTLTKEKTK